MSRCHVKAIGLPNSRNLSAFVLLVGPALLPQPLRHRCGASVPSLTALGANTRPLRDVIHDDPKKREGYGNQTML